MRCDVCPADRHAACGNQGCHVVLAGLRTATVYGLAPGLKLDPAPRLEPGEVRYHGMPVLDGLDVALDRLDVEDGAILVLRTRRKISSETAAQWQDRLERLVRAQGVKDVAILVLDDCTDLAVEPLDTRMAHQPPRPAHIVSR